MTPEEQKEIMKQAFKESYKEFLDEHFATFGKWALSSFIAMALGALTYFILVLNGWKSPQ